MQKLYKTQLLNINLYKYKELYKNLLEKLEELKKEDNNLYLDLIQFYNENYNNEIEKKKVITNIYIAEWVILHPENTIMDYIEEKNKIKQEINKVLNIYDSQIILKEIKK